MDFGTTRRIERLTLALPAYNEAGGIEALLREAAAVFGKDARDWAIIVVDDGSTDETAAIVRRVAGEIPQVGLVQHPGNRGLGPAIVTCLSSALERGDGPEHLIVCMDADLTHPPETIPSMISTAEAGADLVIASRFQPDSRQYGVPPLRGLMSFGARILFRHYLNLPGVRDYTCGFRAFRASLVAAGFGSFGRDGLITRSGFACTDELLVHLAMLGCTIREVPFTLHYDRKQGSSKMNLWVTIRETLNLLRQHRRMMRAGAPAPDPGEPDRDGGSSA